MESNKKSNYTQYSSSAWICTMFDYSNIKDMQTFFEDMYNDINFHDGKLGYVTGQLERCPSTDRLHL